MDYVKHLKGNNMKYIYQNITQTNQVVTLVSKDQNTVSARTFAPKGILELDYPGLTLYVPNLLSCIIVGDENSVPVPVEQPKIEKPISVVVSKPEEPALQIKEELKADEEPSPDNTALLEEVSSIDLTKLLNLDSTSTEIPAQAKQKQADLKQKATKLKLKAQ